MKKTLITAVAIAAVAAAVWLLWGLRTAPPPDLEKTEAKDIAGYLASKDFAALPGAKQAELMNKLQGLPDDKRSAVFRPEGLDDKTRQAMRQNMMGARQASMVAEAKAFFQMSPEEQEAALDKRDEDMAARRAEMQARRASQPPSDPSTARPGPGGRTFNRDPEHMEQRMEQMIQNTTPEDRAYMAEYFKRLRAHQQKK